MARDSLVRLCCDNCKFEKVFEPDMNNAAHKERWVSLVLHRVGSTLGHDSVKHADLCPDCALALQNALDEGVGGQLVEIWLGR